MRGVISRKHIVYYLVVNCIGKLASLGAELKEERDVNAALRGDQSIWREKVEQLQHAIDDITKQKDQVCSAIR